MRLLITGGGTGGHVYPALAVVEALETRGRLELEVRWVGSADGIESDVAPRHGYPFEAVATGRLRGTGLFRAPLEIGRVVLGTAQAYRVVREFRPQLVLATGGYVSAPTVLAGWLGRVRTLLYLPDLEPGWAVSALARFVSAVAVSFPESLQHFPEGRTIVTGYPVRRGILSARRKEARQELGLPEDEKVLLVMGGSQGAHSINQAVADICEELLGVAVLVHVTGGSDRHALAQTAAGLPRRLQDRYRLYDFLHNRIGAALASADLVLARAGASTLGEFPAAGLPSVLVPYPGAGGHQARNARYLASRGAAWVVEEDDLAERLLPSLLALLADDDRRAEMGAAARRLAKPEAAETLADLLEEWARIP